MIKFAKDSGAPFGEKARKRVDNLDFEPPWGPSVYFVIINRSKYNFKLESKECFVGEFTKELLPPLYINAHTSSVFGSEAESFKEGTECFTRYEDKNGSGTFFRVQASTPHTGRNTAEEEHSPALVISHIVGQALHNVARWVIKDKRNE